MNLKHMVWKIFSGLIAALMLASCSLAPQPSPTPAPTIDMKPTFEALAKQAVQTMAAEMTQNAPTATPIIPTDTPAPTATSTVAVSTETPTPTATATRVFIPWTKTPTPTQPVYNCTVTGISPTSGDTIKVDQDFDGKFSVKNSGVKTWLAGNVDFRYIDGTKFQKKADLVDLGSDVAPNGTYTFVVDMKAPSSDGTYSASWGIYLEDGSVCSMTIKINVTK